MRQRDLKPSSTAVTMLASGLVLLGGLCAVTFMIISTDPEPMPKIIGVAVGTLFLAWLLFSNREGTTRRSMWPQFTWFRGGTASHAVWKPRIRRDQSRPAGSNQPPTAEQLHEAAQNTTTWVPTGGSRAAGRSPSDPQKPV